MKKISLLIVLIMILNMFSGCTQKTGETPDAPSVDETSPGTATEPKPTRDTLTIALTTEPPSLAAIEHDSLISASMNILTYNGLMKVDDATLEIVPDLATEYWNENDTDWYFKLRQNVKFHNGESMTSADVVASLEHAKSIPATVQYTQNMKTIEAIDDYTVKIVTDGPYAGLPFDLTFHYNMILPKSLIEAENDFNENPIGTGPYVMTDWKLGDSITYEAFDDFFDTDHLPKIKNLIFKIIPEGASRTIALEAGEVDFIWDVNPADVDTLRDNDDIELVEIKSLDNTILLFNTNKEPFNDQNLRLAVAHAINRQDIVDAALNGFGTPNASVVTQGFWGSTDKGAPEYNIEKAKEYLAKWGGDPATVKLPILCSNEIRVAIATVIQSNLKQIGIEVEVVPMDTAAYFQRTQTGDYTAFIASWSPATSLAYVLRFHSDRNNINPGMMDNPEIDELVIKASKTLNDDERLQMIQQIIEKVNLISPIISLYQSTWYRAHDKNLEGVICSAIGYTSYQNMYWNE